MNQMRASKQWTRTEYMIEVLYFIALFVITMLHEWLELNSLVNFTKALGFFLILYVQAQFHRFFIFPYLLDKRYGIYTLLTVGSLIAGSVILHLASAYLFFKDDPQIPQEPWISFLYTFVICTVSTITIMGLFLTRQYYIELQKRSQDKILMGEMNVKILHAQLNPHFFFNMLNNLYGVSLSEPARTPELILKLSGLMRYQLENSNRSLISIEEEIKFISIYIDMERERVGDRCEITFICPPHFAAGSRYQIAPMMLITLVENAFKHSITIEKNWFVHISIDLQGPLLTLNIWNSKPDQSLKVASTGVGLINVQQKLSILYDQKYSLKMSFDGLECHTKLTIELNQL